MILIAFMVMVEPGTGHGQVPSSLVRGLDHVTVAVRDLDQASRRFRSLGFTLKPGQPHANGIRNQHVKFPNGTEIELLTVDEPGDALAAEYLRYIEQGDGPVFASLYAPDRRTASRALISSGLTVSYAAGLLTFQPGDPLRYLFIGGRNQSPTDRPEHFSHINGATSLTAVWIASGDPSSEIRVLAGLGVATARAVRPIGRDLVETTVASLPEGEVRVFGAERRRLAGRPIIGVTVEVSDIVAASVSVIRRPGGALRSFDRLEIAPSQAHGLWLELRQR